MSTNDLWGFSPKYSEVLKDTPSVSTIKGSSPWKNADVSFNYVRVDYPKLHYHNHWELLILLSGSVTHEINGRFYTLKKGDACFIRPQDCHRLFHGMATETGNYQHLNFLISQEFMKPYCDLLDSALYERLLHFEDILQFHVENRLLIDVIKETVMLQANLPPTADDLRRCKLLLVKLCSYYLDTFEPVSSRYPDWLLSFIVKLKDVSSFSISFPELAKSTPYSYFQLTRVFKRYTGVSLTDYITDAKIEYAKSLLKNTDMTVMNISSTLDFTTGYFSKLFKRKVGITPHEYRKKQKKRT